MFEIGRKSHTCVRNISVCMKVLWISVRSLEEWKKYLSRHHILRVRGKRSVQTEGPTEQSTTSSSLRFVAAAEKQNPHQNKRQTVCCFFVFFLREITRHISCCQILMDMHGNPSPSRNMYGYWSWWSSSSLKRKYTFDTSFTKHQFPYLSRNTRTIELYFIIVLGAVNTRDK